jgi:hypothetical protein
VILQQVLLEIIHRLSLTCCHNPFAAPSEPGREEILKLAGTNKQEQGNVFWLQDKRVALSFTVPDG